MRAGQRKYIDSEGADAPESNGKTKYGKANVDGVFWFMKIDKEGYCNING